MAPLQRRLGEDFVDFAEHTSAHGIPRAYVSKGFRRFLWLLLFLFCFCAFGYQAYLIVLKFLRNDIIVNVEIKYKNIAFPSVTVCNLNPYKTSKALERGDIKDTLDSLDKAIRKSASESEQKSIPFRLRRALPTLRRDSKTPIASRVYCARDGNVWIPKGNGTQRCICASFPSESLYWSCAPIEQWSISICSGKELGKREENENESSFYLCQCNEDVCVEHDWLERVSGKWPLEVFQSECVNSTVSCVCVRPQTNGQEPTIPYCAPWNEWSITPCTMCNWFGRCMRSYGLLSEEECMCHGESADKCFAVETDEDSSMEDTRRHRVTRTTTGNNEIPEQSAIRIRRHNREIYEKILSHYEGLLAVYTTCECTNKHDCKALKHKDESKPTCLCFFNKKNNHVWPCYLPEEWAEKKCTGCSTFGNCMFSDKPSADQDCLCAMPIKMCVRIEPVVENITALEERVVRFWEIQPTTTISPLQQKKEQTEKAFNYVAKDPVALNNQAKENIIFALDRLSVEERKTLSYTKAEFITRCSFNGRECNITNDFATHLDPIYGTCFTFNDDSHEANLTSERAGPNYGLRFQVFVNVEEYMPTTEAAGVRLTVHSSAEQPFPDTLGYSAPTGFVSSFGIRMKHITRLPSPYGDCVENGKDENFIYKHKEYSTEGCQRSCVQQHLVRICGCGDPRYPPWSNVSSCLMDDPEKRECLKRETEFTAKYPEKLACKKCRQPCSQQVFSISYSASRWPASPLDRNDCPKGLSSQQCLAYLREQGAMIEVFFEQLNYEALQESEAYGLPNLLSDFGGQLGLWMGVSMITITEVGILVFDIFLSFVGYGKRERKRSRRRSMTGSLRYSFKGNGNGTTFGSPISKSNKTSQQTSLRGGCD